MEVDFGKIFCMNKWFVTYLRSLPFVPSAMDTSLFVYRNGDDIAYILLYADDIVLTASSDTLLHNIINRLHSEFSMTYPGGSS